MKREKPVQNYPRRISIDGGGLICTINEDLTLTDKSGSWRGSWQAQAEAEKRTINGIEYVYIWDAFAEFDHIRYKESDFIIEPITYTAEWI